MSTSVNILLPPDVAEPGGRTVSVESRGSKSCPINSMITTDLRLAHVLRAASMLSLRSTTRLLAEFGFTDFCL
jgi:hypothetical protein